MVAQKERATHLRKLKPSSTGCQSFCLLNHFQLRQWYNFVPTIFDIYDFAHYPKDKFKLGY